MKDAWLETITLFKYRKNNLPVDLVRWTFEDEEERKVCPPYAVQYGGGGKYFFTLREALNYIEDRWHKTYWERDIIKRLDAADKKLWGSP